jgi:hypothetical protein
MPYTPNDPICPLCKKAVEPQHAPAVERGTGKRCHDYCQRIKDKTK